MFVPDYTSRQILPAIPNIDIQLICLLPYFYCILYLPSLSCSTDSSSIYPILSYPILII